MSQYPGVPGGYPGLEQPGEPGGGGPGGPVTPAPGPGGPNAPVVSGVTAPASAGGGAPQPGLFPPLTAPKGSAVLIQESPVHFRYILPTFEGLNTRQSPMEIGELQHVESKNLLTDEATLRKRGGATDVSTGGTSGVCVGLTEVAMERTLTLQACDDETQWTESDAVNFAAINETTIKVQGTGSIRVNATGAAANGDTLLHDLGAGATKDLSQFDYVEVLIRGNFGTSSVTFGISEDNVTYTSVSFSGDAETFQTLRLDISGLAATARDAIRYLRWTYTDVSGSAVQFYFDIIYAGRRTAAFIRATAANAVSGGVRSTASSSGQTVLLETDRSGTWTTLTGANLVGPVNMKVRMLSWLGQTFIMGGPVALRFQESTFSAAEPNEIKSWPEAPPSRFLFLHQEKLWGWSQDYDRHAMRHTDTNSFTSWPTTSSPAARGDGGTIYVGRQYPYFPTGGVSAFGQLFLMTEGDLWILFGTDNSDFRLVRAHPGGGTLSHESIAICGDTIIWHDGLRDRVLMWQGGQVYDIGDPVQNELDDIPAGLKPWTAGLFTGRYYLLSYAATGGTTNNRTLLYDTILRRWHGPYQGSWVGFNTGLVASDGSLVVGMGGQGAADFVKRILTGTSDDGAAIAMTYKTGDVNPRTPRWAKRIRRAWMKVSNTTATFTLNFYLNRSASAIRSYALTGTGATMETLSTGVHNDVVGDVIQAELTESSTNAVTINEIGFDGALLRALR